MEANLSHPSNNDAARDALRAAYAAILSWPTKKNAETVQALAGDTISAKGEPPAKASDPRGIITP